MVLSLGQIILGLSHLGGWFLLLALVFVPLERIFPKVRQKIIRRGWYEDLGFYFLNGFLPPLLIVFPAAALGAIQNQLAPNGFYNFIGELPMFLRLFGAILVGEMGAYWGHRLSHQLPCLWWIHSVHHKAEDLDWLVNTRAHPLDFVVSRTFGLAPVYLLGFAQVNVSLMDSVSFIYVAIGTFWSFFVHANLCWRFGFLEHFLASPAFHHWHHANDDVRHINHNYASIFPWVDKIFGTLLLPKQRWPRSYGIIPSHAHESDYRDFT